MIEFKYHKSPIKNNVFVEQNEKCPVCDKYSIYSYVGPMYSYDDVEYICPICISNGRAAKKYNAEFVDDEFLDKKIKKEYLDTLLHKTPGVFFPGQELWPSHCNDFCQFESAIKFIDDKYINENENEISRLAALHEMTVAFFVSEVNKDYSPFWCLEFKCLHCNSIFLVADYE
ncbi:CbrC family protein [Photobacterium kishitanii]|uniref:CbrC family protein n=1 Tax=Photobacterium kishitanii TaxID=318456 RepID=UPI0027386BD5|nr:CbrC family protein [Photobacterium kishitanii]